MPMPHIDPETKRAYHREYMRRRRAAVKPEKETVFTLVSEVPQFTRRRQMNRVLDRNRPYTIEGRYTYPAYLVQDGLWFDPDTGKVVGVAH
jgi:hypothetical protein